MEPVKAQMEPNTGGAHSSMVACARFHDLGDAGCGAMARLAALVMGFGLKLSGIKPALLAFLNVRGGRCRIKCGVQ